MDEPTSSLDNNFENLMFELLHQKLPKETTIITVSHTKELSKYHDHILDIQDNAKEELLFSNDLCVVSEK